MDITKKGLNILLLFILAIFPFGQLPGIFLKSVFNFPFRLHAIDILIGVYISIYLLKYSNFSKLKALLSVVVVFGFSLIISIFEGTFGFIGLFYFLRLIIYLFFIHILNIQVEPKYLVLVGLVVALLGWVQYFTLPDLTALKFFGWDDHYFRLTSTFLDPAFTGIILSLAALLALRKKYIFSSIFLIASLGFTYSRASFLAFFVGVIFLFFKKDKKFLSILIIFLALIIVLLPRSPGGEGVKLARTSSVKLKIENFAQSTKIISNSPLFGVGYNNICKAKESLSFNIEKQKNSCSGLDNSFLFILATAGALGLFTFIHTLSRLFRGSELLTASLAAVFVHSLFTNTLFYPWILVWLALLRPTARK